MTIFMPYWLIASVIVFYLFVYLPMDLWIYFLAVMALKRAKKEGKLSGFAAGAGTTVLVRGYWRDFWCNMIPFTVFMLDWPREATVTARLKRYKAQGTGWRYRFALWFADDMLDDYEMSGNHV